LELKLQLHRIPIHLTQPAIPTTSRKKNRSRTPQQRPTTDKRSRKRGQRDHGARNPSQSIYETPAPKQDQLQLQQSVTPPGPARDHRLTCPRCQAPPHHPERVLRHRPGPRPRLRPTARPPRRPPHHRHRRLPPGHLADHPARTRHHRTTPPRTRRSPRRPGPPLEPALGPALADHLPHRQNTDRRTHPRRRPRLPRPARHHHPVAVHPVRHLPHPRPRPATATRRPRHHRTASRRPTPAARTPPANRPRSRTAPPHHRPLRHRRRPALRPLLRPSARRTGNRTLRRRTPRLPPGMVALRTTQTRQRPPEPHRPTLAPPRRHDHHRPLVEPTLAHQLATHLHPHPQPPPARTTPDQQATPMDHNPTQELAHPASRPASTPRRHRHHTRSWDVSGSCD